jgi:hypothetical protein
MNVNQRRFDTVGLDVPEVEILKLGRKQPSAAEQSPAIDYTEKQQDFLYPLPSLDLYDD